MACLTLVLLALYGGLSGLSTAAIAAPELQFRAGTPSDRDGDGIDNAVDGDDDNDLVADEDEPPGDADGDGVPNGFDTDADNDGIADLVEAITDPALLALLDANGDGVLDADVEVGANGMADLAESAPDTGSFITGRVDVDGDGVPDPYDLDSDNDGLADVVEAGGTDADGDARVDRFRDFDDDGRDDQLSLFPIVPRDTDGDGLLDFRDTDSDGDGASDRRESSGTDTDGDGVIDGFVDDDGDGLDDRVAAEAVVPIDSGGDRRPDHLDADFTPDSIGSVGDLPSGAGNDGAGRPVTGRAGNALGGCSIAAHGRAGSAPVVDPTLVALALLSLGALGLGTRRRRAAASVAAVLALGGCTSFERPRDGFGIDGYHAGAGIGASRLDADLDGTSFVADDRGSTSAQLTFGATLAPWLDGEVRAADLGSMTFEGGGSIGYQVVDVGAVVRQRRGVGECCRGIALTAATELRARAAGVTYDVNRVAMAAAFAHDDPSLLWRWSERLRAVALVRGPGRYRSGAVADAVADAMTELRLAALKARTSGEQKPLAEAEANVRHLLRTANGDGLDVYRPLDSPPLDSTTFIEHAGHLHRIDCDSAGELQLHMRLCSLAELDRRAKVVRSDWRRCLRHGKEAAHRVAAWEALDESLESLDQILAVRPWCTGLTLIVSESLHQVPWMALPSLAGVSLSVGPSGAAVAPKQKANSHYTEPDVVLAAGPGLAHVDDELTRLMAVWPGAKVFPTGTTSVNELITAVSGSHVVHLAAHGTFRSDASMFSALEFDDGPMTAIDLEGVEIAPEVAILSACDAGTSSVLPGNETLGMVPALLSVGCHSVIAPVLPVADEDCHAVMEEIHRGLAGGLAPSRALNEAAKRFPAGSEEQRLASSFVCFGVG